MLFLLTVIVIGLFLLFLQMQLGIPEITQKDHIEKIYTDKGVLDITLQDITTQSSNAKVIIYRRLEELLQTIAEVDKHPQVYANATTHTALTALLKHPILKQYIHNDTIITYEVTPYSMERKYGGYYCINSGDIAYAYLIGEPDAILSYCSQIHDSEEISRMYRKWKKQGLEVIAFATADSDKPTKNILKRGVKDKMTFLGMVGIRD